MARFESARIGIAIRGLYCRSRSCRARNAQYGRETGQVEAGSNRHPSQESLMRRMYAAPRTYGLILMTAAAA